MEDNAKVFIAKADIDIESLLTDIEGVHRPDRMLDLRIAAVTGVYDHYAPDPKREPSSISLSFNDYYDCVNIKVSNNRGGGLEYSDRLPKFTESLDATYAVAQVLTNLLSRKPGT